MSQVLISETISKDIEEQRAPSLRDLLRVLLYLFCFSIQYSNISGLYIDSSRTDPSTMAFVATSVVEAFFASVASEETAAGVAWHEPGGGIFPIGWDGSGVDEGLVVRDVGGSVISGIELDGRATNDSKGALAVDAAFGGCSGGIDDVSSSVVSGFEATGKPTGLTIRALADVELASFGGCICGSRDVSGGVFSGIEVHVRVTRNSIRALANAEIASFDGRSSGVEDLSSDVDPGVGSEAKPTGVITGLFYTIAARPPAIFVGCGGGRGDIGGSVLFVVRFGKRPTGDLKGTLVTGAFWPHAIFERHGGGESRSFIGDVVPRIEVNGRGTHSRWKFAAVAGIDHASLDRDGGVEDISAGRRGLDNRGCDSQSAKAHRKTKESGRKLHREFRKAG